MATNIQSSHMVGSIIDVEVQLTAHHQGHFIFKACPINNTTTIPTQECFDKYPLQFISDELYGAPVWILIIRTECTLRQSILPIK